jgi:hypothetical protein
MKNSEIFNSEFLNINNREMLSTLKDEGVFYIKNAVNTNFLDSLLTEIDNNKFSVNKNWASGVYTEHQYYVNHLLGCSKSFYSLISSSSIFDMCDEFFKSEYRLKAFRYYETYSKHKMDWHTDNKISKKNEPGSILKQIPGIILIVYLDDVKDGEFQFVKKSHKQSNVNNYNVYTNKQILEKFQNDVVSFKGCKGDLIIYDTYGIHRAKPVISYKNFVRKSLFIQIDENLTSAVPLLVNPSYFDKLDNKTLKYFGFGLPCDSQTGPNTNIKRLPIKIFFKEILLPYIPYKLPRVIYMMFPRRIRQFFKKFFKK